MRMDAVDGEGNDAGLFRRILAADDVDVRIFPSLQAAFVKTSSWASTLSMPIFQVVDSGVESYGAFDVLGTGFKFEGQFVDTVDCS